ncbi:MAG TPA: ATP-binding protein [Spirochaetota bacterium]|nr:ATP-binding protein [Spirochaetota bacterium]HPS87201.1 ATP-binding protein [Spirochaetota bacterium]
MFNIKNQNARNVLYWIMKIFIPNLIFAVFIFGLLAYAEDIKKSTYYTLLAGMLIYFFSRLYFYYYRVGFFLWNNLKNLRQIINEFKKGKFILTESDINVTDNISQVLKELLTVGKQFESIVSSQSDELKKFHEIYSHIICSINSHFIVIDKTEKILYVNESFCKKFNIEGDKVIGKGLSSVFYFVNTRLKMGINQLIKNRESDSVVLKNLHLMSVNRKSIISDLKISSMNLNGEEQIVIIIDDITDRFSKDYHASILSHLSETMGVENETETTFYNILAGVTSGSGLGFNRAMLFMVENDMLQGKMAVGPDSFEEAIEIWNSLSSSDVDVTVQYPIEIKRGALLKKVQAYRVSLSEDNVFTQAVKNMERIHIHGASSDPRVSEEIRNFLEVDEFLIMPMISFQKVIGIIIADNKYNMTGISMQSVDLLSIFSFQSAFLIESYLNLIEVRKEMKKIEERQEAIIESEKMAAVGRIASHIAHEIRNPLVTMGGYSKRILKYTSENMLDIKKVIKSADIILKESERLEKILSNVMDFTKPSKYIKEFNDVNHIIRDTYRLLKNVLLEKNIKITMTLSENLPNVKSDFNQMKQVFLNLFQNAIEATPSGGSLTIITEPEELYVTIRIIDSGSGIKAEDPEIIFEPFFTTKVTGVGLGLANVKKIIKDHRGKITAFNNEEGGAEFVIKLPIPSSEQKNPDNEIFIQ